MHTLLYIDDVTNAYCIPSSVLMMSQVHTAYPPQYWWCSSYILMVQHICTECPPPYCIPSTVLHMVYTGSILFHSNQTFPSVWIHKNCFFPLNKMYEKAFMFFKVVIKIVFITKRNEKIVWNAFFSKRKLFSNPKNGNPPPLNKTIMVRPLVLGLSFHMYHSVRATTPILGQVTSNIT